MMRMMSALLISASALAVSGFGKDGKLQDAALAADSYAPVTLALSCRADGMPEGSVYFARAPDIVDPSGGPRECVDRSKIARDMKPLGIRLVDRERLQLWAVVIRLSPSDAAKMRHVTSNAEGRRSVIIVNKRVLRASTIYGAFTGDDLYLSATSRADAVQLAGQFMEISSATNGK